MTILGGYLFKRKVCGNSLLKIIAMSLITYHLSLITSSCSSIDCPVENTVATHYAVFNAQGEEVKLTDTLWVWSRRIDGKDTLLNRAIDLSQFSLQVSYKNPEDTLIFFKGSPYAEWTLDTLWLKKDDIPHFESVDCSAHFFHRITAVRSTHEGIDSVVIANPNVDYDPQKIHLNIYFK